MNLPKYTDIIFKDKRDFERAKKFSDEIKDTLISITSAERAMLKTTFKTYKTIELTNERLNPDFVDFAKAYSFFNNFLSISDETLKNKIHKIILGFDDLRHTIDLVREANGILFSRSQQRLKLLFEPHHQSAILFIRLFKEVSDDGKNSSDGTGIADLMAKLGEDATIQTISAEKH